MSSRQQRAQIAAETLAIARSGAYRAPSGAMVSLQLAQQAAEQHSESIAPAAARSLRGRAEQTLAARNFVTTFAVRNETTFSAARRLVRQLGAARVAALNFASAKSPGGGFLNGAQAQEECLARASGLFPCLERHSVYYDANRRERSLLYTDHMIVSPRVPVFRDDSDRLIEEPWEVTIITAPAPNAAAIAANEPAAIRDIEPTFRRRIEHVLSAAVVFEQTALVLGAWGCGVFGNDPALVAKLFGEFLLPTGTFHRAFEHVAFAVLDRTGGTFAAFDRVFGRS